MGIDLYGKKCGHTKASRDMTSTHTGKSVLGFCFVLIDLMPPFRCPTVHSGQAEAHKAHISLFPQWQVWLKLHQVSWRLLHTLLSQQKEMDFHVLGNFLKNLV